MIRQSEKGLSFGAPTELEIQLADRICEIMPGMDLVRMVNSGTEATMSAIRLARGYTGRDTIVKFEGCYHGHSDSLLVKAGSGALTLGVPSSPGVPASLADHTLTLDLQRPRGRARGVCRARRAHRLRDRGTGGRQYELHSAAAGLPGNTARGLHRQRRGADPRRGDDRLSLRPAGAQGYYGIEADLTTLGKVIGGGMPVGAFGGKREIMEQIAPLGPVYQAGTLSGNPIAMAAGLATLDIISGPGFYEPLFERTEQLCEGLRAAAAEAGVPFTTNHAGTMFGGFFTAQATVTNYEQVMACDTAAFNRFFHLMLEQGVYLAPASYEAGFMSSAHSEHDIAQTVAAAQRAFAGL